MKAIKYLFVFLVIYSSSTVFASDDMNLDKLIRESGFIGIVKDTTTYVYLPGDSFKETGCIFNKQTSTYAMHIEKVLKGNKKIHLFEFGLYSSLPPSGYPHYLVLASDRDFKIRNKMDLFHTSNNFTESCKRELKTKQIWDGDLTTLWMIPAVWFKDKYSKLPKDMQDKLNNEDVIFLPSNIDLPDELNQTKNNIFLRQLQNSTEVFRKNTQAIYLSDFVKYLEQCKNRKSH
jgi:hypothetical protein